ncbi:hypothetical protein [Crucivirus-293]|nr:hypothetical protein [Crucivirus-293]
MCSDVSCTCAPRNVWVWGCGYVQRGVGYGHGLARVCPTVPCPTVGGNTKAFGAPDRFKGLFGAFVFLYLAASPGLCVTMVNMVSLWCYGGKCVVFPSLDCAVGGTRGPSPLGPPAR